MNWLDIVILVIIALATVGGLGIGIIRAGLSLLGLVVGIVLAGRFYIPFSHLLDAVLQSSVAKVVAFVIILAAVMVAAAFLAMFLRRGASAIKLGWADHFGGAVFGLVMGAIFCSALLALWVKFVGSGETVAESALAPILLGLLDHLPAGVRSFFQ